MSDYRGNVLVCSTWGDAGVKVWGWFHRWDWLAEGHAVHVRRETGRAVWIEERGKPAVRPAEP